MIIGSDSKLGIATSNTNETFHSSVGIAGAPAR